MGRLPTDFIPIPIYARARKSLSLLPFVFRESAEMEAVVMSAKCFAFELSAQVTNQLLFFKLEVDDG